MYLHLQNNEDVFGIPPCRHIDGHDGIEATEVCI
jgi:hypothetical protein